MKDPDVKWTPSECTTKLPTDTYGEIEFAEDTSSRKPVSYQCQYVIVRDSTPIDDYAKDGGLGVVLTSCSFHHHDLWLQRSYWVRCAGEIHKLPSNSFSETVYVISSDRMTSNSKAIDSRLFSCRCAEANGKSYTKVRPPLVRHL